MRNIIIFSTTILCIGVVAYTQRTTALSFFGQWNLISNARVTEVVLLNRETIPAEVEPGQMIPLSFSIANYEGIEKTYQYTIGVRRTAASTSPLRILQHGTIVVPNHATSDIHMNYTVGSLVVPVTIYFSLIDPDREVYVQIPQS